jgi:arginyl-tRNA synthetase
MTSKDYIDEMGEEYMDLRAEAIKAIQKHVAMKKKEIDNLLEVPPDSKLGDLAFPCFALSKIYKKAPGAIAFDLREKIVVPKSFSKVEIAGPYLNFFYNKTYLSEIVLKQALKKDFGNGKKTNKTIVVESPAPNTNKPLHLGHVRNMALGQAVANVLAMQGNNVKIVDLYNDRGVHICKSMLAYKNWGKNKKPIDKSDHFVGDYYVMFSKKAKDKPDLEKEAKKMLADWESGDKNILALWKKMNKWAISGFEETYKIFGHKPVKVYRESEIYKKGKSVILDGLKKGVFYKDKTGAVAINLGKKLGEKILLRSDGTSVYITQDLALTTERYNDFKMDKAIWIVGNEQIYHFEVLFKLFKLLKFPFAEGCYHLAYGMVNLPDGKMKSREGTVVDADDLINDMVSLAKKEINKRHKLPKKQVDKIAYKIGIGAIKYFMLKYAAKKDFIFDPKQSVSFDGETGPYLQYALVRASKIMKKSKQQISGNIGYDLLSSKEEQELIKQISKFPEVVEQSAESYSPHFVATFAYELAQKFSTFYSKHRVIGADPKQEKARLLLVNVFYETLKKSLNLLGINEVEVM